MGREVPVLSKRKKDKGVEKEKEKEKSLADAVTDGASESLSKKTGPVILLGLICLAPYLFLLVTSDLGSGLKRSILMNLAISVAGFFLTVMLIPVTSRYLLKRNMFGYDINKKGSDAGTVKVPESLGLVTGIVFLTAAILFQPFYFTPDHSGLAVTVGKWLPEYNAALTSICFMLFLGFVDDVLDIPWRVKLLLPSIAALPLLMAYGGHTTVLIPKPLQALVGSSLLDLGWVYKLYMGLLAVFCTNSINILAGVNGLEVGQAVVIACAVLMHNVIQMMGRGVYDTEIQEAHSFSIFLMQPLVATSLGLLLFNWYPSSVFVGDTFTYFSGMALAVVGISGHFRSDIERHLSSPSVLAEAFSVLEDYI